ncbi:MAG: lytic transglycosylase domain-containing protein [Clostridia bacterium]|nr:lytic transglycosylase domain-containing protein [Clostridia bacterium]
MKNILYPTHYKNIVEIFATEYNVDKMLVFSVIKTESGFNTRAQSVKDAKGLMQITDETSKWAFEQIGIDKDADIFDPEINIQVGTWYLSKLIKDNSGDLVTALASYNAGSGNVQKWKDASGKDTIAFTDIEFKETENYVKKTLKYYDVYKKLYKTGE